MSCSACIAALACGGHLLAMSWVHSRPSPLPLCSCSLLPCLERKARGTANVGPPMHLSRPFLGCSEGQDLRVHMVCPQRVV